MERPHPFDPQTLVTHVDFVRRLARGLVRGADAADELTAEALAAAVAQRPQTGPAFRGWLRRVVGRLARRHVIADERRLAREQAAALPERGERGLATDDLAAQIELERDVALAFTSLAEPYRSTLFRRYWLDLTPVQIAERTSTPLPTVKSRLQRGLEQLRDRLDAAHRGGREQWLAALVPWLSSGGPVMATTITAKSKLVPIAVAATLVAGATLAVLEPWNRGADGDDPARGALPIAAHADDDAARGAARREDAPPLASPKRALVAADPASLPFASGLVTDAAGAPLADVAVVASRIVYGRDASPPGEQLAFDYAGVARDTLARTGADGSFVVAGEASRDDALVAFWFVKPGFGLGQWWELAESRSANQQLAIVLTPARPVRGSVRDSDGRPIANAEVGIGVLLEMGEQLSRRVARNLPGAPEYTAAPAVGPQRAKSDREGRFELPSVPRGRCTVGASADGYGYAALTEDALPDPWNPVLLRSDLLIDVVDADTQAPIRAASAILVARATGRVLTMAWSSFEGEGDAAHRVGERLNVPLGFAEPGVVTNQRGFLEMQRPPWLVDARGQTLDVELRVVADGYRGDFVDLTLSTKSEPPHLRVELVPDDGEPGEVSIAGKVLGASDPGNVDVRLYLFAAGWDASTLRSGPPLLTTKSAANGAFAFRELPAARYLLVANAKGFSPATLEVEAPCGGVTLELLTAAALEVVVVDRAGQPVAGAVVHAQDEAGKEAHMRATGADGVARFDKMPEGKLRALAFVVPDAKLYASFDRASPLDARCFAPGDVVDARAGETARMELPLLERVPVRLHFRHDDGTPVTQVALEWSGMESGSPALAVGTEFERLQSLKLELDPLGDATLELYPGRYVIQAAEAAIRRWITIDVPRAAEASATLLLPDRGPSGTLRGRLVDLVSGAPIGYRDVLAIWRPAGATPSLLGTQTSDSDGRFAFADVPVGAIELEVHADSLGGRGRGSPIADPSSLWGRALWRAHVEADRETTVEIALPPVRPGLIGRSRSLKTLPFDALVTDAQSGAPIAGATVELYALVGDGELFAGSAQTDADGRARTDVFATEKYRAEVSTPWDMSAGTPKPPKYRGRNLELAPKDGRLAVDVALERRE